MHHPLGFAGGAGGIEQRGQVQRDRGLGRRRGRRVGQRFVQIFHPRRQRLGVGRAQHPQGRRLFRHRTEHARQMRLGEQRASARVAQDEGQLVALGLGIDGDEHAAGQQHAEDGRGAPPAVVHENHHAVAALHAARTQGMGQATGVVRHLAVAQPRVSGDQRRALRIARDRGEQDLLQEAGNGVHDSASGGNGLLALDESHQIVNGIQVFRQHFLIFHLDTEGFLDEQHDFQNARGVDDAAGEKGIVIL